MRAEGLWRVGVLIIELRVVGAVISVQTARHRKYCATSSIAAHRCKKKARVGNPGFVMGRKEQNGEKDRPPAELTI